MDEPFKSSTSSVHHFDTPARTDMGVDFTDPDVRRRLCTGLVELLNRHGPKDADIRELIEKTDSLADHEKVVLREYFKGSSRKVGSL